MLYRCCVRLCRQGKSSVETLFFTLPLGKQDLPTGLGGQTLFKVQNPRMFGQKPVSLTSRKQATPICWTAGVWWSTGIGLPRARSKALSRSISSNRASLRATSCSLSLCSLFWKNKKKKHWFQATKKRLSHRDKKIAVFAKFRLPKRQKLFFYRSTQKPHRGYKRPV